MLPKILFIEIAHHFGGSGARLLTILKHLPPESIGLACLSNSETGRKAKEFGIKVHEVGRVKYDPAIFSRLIGLIKKESYSVIDTQNINSKIWGAAAALFTDAAFVSTVNSNYVQEFNNPIKRWLITTAEYLTNVRVNKFISVSEEVKTGLIESGIQPNKISMVTNAIQLEPEDISIKSSKFDEVISGKENLILAVSVGRLVWIKGHDVLIEAVSSVRKIHPNFLCLIIGDGPIKNNLQFQIQNLDLENSVLLTGFLSLDEVHYLIINSDMFIMPSRTEGTPIAILEAAALARPIIASNVGGIPDVITDQVDGMLVRPEDPDELAAAIIKLIEDQNLSHRLGENAKEKILREYSPEVQAEKLKNIYMQTIKKVRA
jgi:glycosyltransferase involved in cell wall biosynthesis